MAQYGTFYTVTVKLGVRPNRLKKFLLTEWFTWKIAKKLRNL